MDTNYVPSSQVLHKAQSGWIYKMQQDTFQEPFAKSVVIKHTDDKDVATIWEEVCEYHDSSMTNSLRVGTISNYITSVRLHKQDFRGNLCTWLLNFSEQVRLHNEMVSDPQDWISSGQAVNFLEAAVMGVDKLSNVRNAWMAANKGSGRANAKLELPEYLELLLDQAAVIDAPKSRATAGKYRANVNEYVFEDEDDDDDVYTPDASGTYNISNHEFDVDTPPEYMMYISERGRGPNNNNIRRKAWLDKNSWTSLSEEDRKIWDQLSDSAKTTIRSAYQKNQGDTSRRPLPPRRSTISNHEQQATEEEHGEEQSPTTLQATTHERGMTFGTEPEEEDKETTNEKEQDLLSHMEQIAKGKVSKNTSKGASQGQKTADIGLNDILSEPSRKVVKGRGIPYEQQRNVGFHEVNMDTRSDETPTGTYNCWVVEANYTPKEHKGPRRTLQADMRNSEANPPYDSQTDSSVNQQASNSPGSSEPSRENESDGSWHVDTDTSNMSPQEKSVVKDLLQQEGDRKEQSQSEALVPYDPNNKEAVVPRDPNNKIQVRIIDSDGTVVAQSDSVPATTRDTVTIKDQQDGGKKVQEQRSTGPILTYTPPSDQEIQDVAESITTMPVKDRLRMWEVMLPIMYKDGALNDALVAYANEQVKLYADSHKQKTTPTKKPDEGHTAKGSHPGTQMPSDASKNPVSMTRDVLAKKDAKRGKPDQPSTTTPNKANLNYSEQHFKELKANTMSRQDEFLTNYYADMGIEIEDLPPAGYKQDDNTNQGSSTFQDNDPVPALQDADGIIQFFEDDLTLEELQASIAKSQEAKRATESKIVTDPDEIAAKLTKPYSKVKMFSQKYNEGSNHNWGTNADHPSSGSVRPARTLGLTGQQTSYKLYEPTNGILRPTGKGITTAGVDSKATRPKYVRQGQGTSVAFSDDTKPPAGQKPKMKSPLSTLGQPQGNKETVVADEARTTQRMPKGVKTTVPDNGIPSEVLGGKAAPLKVGVAIPEFDDFIDELDLPTSTHTKNEESFIDDDSTLTTDASGSPETDSVAKLPDEQLTEKQLAKRRRRKSGAQKRKTKKKNQREAAIVDANTQGTDTTTKNTEAVKGMTPPRASWGSSILGSLGNLGNVCALTPGTSRYLREPSSSDATPEGSPHRGTHGVPVQQELQSILDQECNDIQELTGHTTNESEDDDDVPELKERTKKSDFHQGDHN